MTPREYQQSLAIRTRKADERLYDRMARVNREAAKRALALRRQPVVHHFWGGPVVSGGGLRLRLFDSPLGDVRILYRRRAA